MDIIKHPIKPEKEKTWHYKSHQYFTKQASNVVSEYINHFTSEGDTVLDPYCGTGVTAIEALLLKRKVILFDLNPLACFITKQNCSTINLDELYKTFRLLEEKVKPTIDKYFKMSNKSIEGVELNYWYPKKIKMPLNADFNYVEDLFTKKQLLSFSLILHHINKIKDTEIKNAFLFVFSASLAKANRTFMPSEKDGKQIGGGGSSIFGTYRYWKPKKLREIHVWDNFVQRFKFYASGKEIWNNLVKGIDVNKNLKIINDTVLNIEKYIRPDSMDYIYTDPPYGGNIAYLDLSTMWNAWLGFKVTEKEKKEEIIEGGDLGKSQENYEELFSKSFEVMSKVLKKTDG
ncbi:MAG: DNA methyltransferase [Ignavibacteriae bacterium]|nr:DNA methyltransferase [Ignavibacteriota bacterium]